MSKPYGVIAKDEFNDLQLVDQYIPLEEVYVDDLYPFNTFTANNYSYSYQQQETNQYSTLETYREDFKENNDYYRQNQVDFNRNQVAPNFDYYNCVNESPVIQDLSANYTPITHTNFLDTNEQKISVQAGEKPPEPYANIIVKAILSTSHNVMQLKDIYNYMVEK